MGYRLANGRWLHVLGEGRLVNLAAGDGHPVEIMDMSFGIQALCARYIAEHRGALEAKLHAVPVEIDREVAERKLAALGVQIDTLSREQQAYLDSWDA
jgi:adenosylhomocysteinase